MRTLYALLTLLPLLMLFQGCGGGKPDPRDREGFVDTTDPDAIMIEMGPPPRPGGGAAGGPGN
jgi:hypothetical protein